MKKIHLYVKCLLIFVLLVAGNPFMLFSSGASAQTKSVSFTDLPDDVSVRDAIARLVSLRVFDDVNQKFYPKLAVNREQFAKSIVLIANQAERAEQYAKSSSLFPDVSSKRWSNGYIQWVVKNNLMNGLSDRKFHPAKPVTMAQAITVLVRLLGYQDADIKGIWPENYLVKAKELQLLQQTVSRSSALLTRQELAVLMDRFVMMSVKNSTKTYAEHVGLFQEAIVFSNSVQNGIEEIKTSIGTFQNPFGHVITVGDRVRIKVEDGAITNTFATQTKLEIATIDTVQFPQVQVKRIDQSSSLKRLSLSASYYLNGNKLTFDQLNQQLRVGQKIVFGKYEAKATDDYVVIFDAKYENGTYNELILLDNSTTSVRLEDNQIQTDLGVFQLNSTVKSLQPGLKYGFYVQGDQIIASEGERNRIREVEIVQVNGGSLIVLNAEGVKSNLALSPKSSYYYNGTKQNYDALKTILKVGQKLQLAMENELVNASYVVIRDPFPSGLGTYQEMIVLANASTNDRLQSSQIQTDLGIYNISSLNETISLGAKYGFLIGTNNQVLSVKLIQNAHRGTVLRNLDNQLTWMKNNISETMILPQSTIYYHNGTKISYEQLKTVMQASSTLFLLYNADRSLIETALVIDPIYQMPQIATALSNVSGMIGNIVIGDQTIIRDGYLSSREWIGSRDVAYQVTDLEGNNKYITIYSNRITGNFKAFSPSLLSPVSILVEAYNVDSRKFEVKAYELSKHFNLSQLSNASLKSGAYITVLFGQNGKVIDLILE